MSDQQQITFRVIGDPRPQGKMNIGRNATNTKQWIRNNEDGKLRAWRRSIAAAARLALGDAPQFAGPVLVRATFMYRRPSYHYGAGRNAHVLRAGMPDLPVGGRTHDIDKLLRALLDGLTDSGVWRDDAQAAAVIAYRKWNDQPGAAVRVQTIGETP